MTTPVVRQPTPAERAKALAAADQATQGLERAKGTGWRQAHQQAYMAELWILTREHKEVPMSY